MAMTGGVAQNGKQLLIALQLWRDDVNAKGGLLGRPVELVFYDDQSNPSNVPGIYTKLINVDKVDLLLGPYATNMAAAAMPVIMENNKTHHQHDGGQHQPPFQLPEILLDAADRPRRGESVLQGLFRSRGGSRTQSRRRSRSCQPMRSLRETSADGARENATADGFKIIYDKSYPPATTDFAPTVRAMQAANPDIVFVAAYPPDTVGIVRAAHEIGLKPKMFGGTMIGLLITPIKTQLGPILDGIVIMESFVPAPTFNFPGVADVLKRYRAVAAGEKIDPLGYGFVPFGYAAGQVLAQAVEGSARALDQSKLAEYMHSHKFDDRGRRSPIRHGRRMDEGAHRVHAIPERGAKRCRAIRQRQGRSRSCGRRNTRPAT